MISRSLSIFIGLPGLQLELIVSSGKSQMVIKRIFDDFTGPATQVL